MYLQGQSYSFLCVPLTDGIFRNGSEDLEEMDFEVVENDRGSYSSTSMSNRRESTRSVTSSTHSTGPASLLGRSPSRSAQPSPVAACKYQYNIFLATLSSLHFASKAV